MLIIRSLWWLQDLTHIGRPLKDILIVDNSPFSYMFQPENAIPITSWFNDDSDRELDDLLPYLDKLKDTDDVCPVLARKEFTWLSPGTDQILHA